MVDLDLARDETTREERRRSTSYVTKDFNTTNRRLYHLELLRSARWTDEDYNLLEAINHTLEHLGAILRIEIPPDPSPLFFDWPC